MWGTFSARTCSFILGPDWFSSPTFPQPIRCRCGALWWQILFFYTPHAIIDFFFFCFYSLVFCSPCGKAKGKSHFLRSIFSFSIFNCIMQWNHWATKGGRGAKVNFICECGQDASEIGVLGSATSIGSHCSAVKSSNLAFNWFSGGG